MKAFVNFFGGRQRFMPVQDDGQVRAQPLWDMGTWKGVFPNDDRRREARQFTGIVRTGFLLCSFFMGP